MTDNAMWPWVARFLLGLLAAGSGLAWLLTGFRTSADQSAVYEQAPHPGATPFAELATEAQRVDVLRTWSRTNAERARNAWDAQAARLFMPAFLLALIAALTVGDTPVWATGLMGAAALGLLCMLYRNEQLKARALRIVAERGEALVRSLREPSPPDQKSP